NYLFFSSHATATTDIYTLSLHDALPIYADDIWTLTRINEIPYGKSRYGVNDNTCKQPAKLPTKRCFRPTFNELVIPPYQYEHRCDIHHHQYTDAQNTSAGCCCHISRQH